MVPAALIASTIINANGGGKDGKPVSIADFLPGRGAPESPAPENLDDKALSFFSRHGVVRPEKTPQP